MDTQVAQSIDAPVAYRSPRVRAIALLGPLTAVVGVCWAIIQPYRLTILHPHGQGVWWLIAEPPLFVVAVGIIFAVLVARPLIADLEGSNGAAR